MDNNDLNIDLNNLDLNNINTPNEELHKNDNININLVLQYIDCCIGSSGSHYDIALTMHEILKDSYRYIGNKTWQHFNKDNKIWENDDKNDKLKIDIKSKICDQFILRSLYWAERSKDKDIAANVSFDHQLRSAKLLQCSYKLKDNKFILLILKEAKQLFNYND